mmetsp:Transcript_26583/g.62451  ORF Transcript_26583/g.62451 Transcript_26583/m.62451 type:complete len:1018 (-) Transcript_26583:109-3162(-)
MNSSLIEASSPRGGPTISSKKRRRNNMSKSTEERIRHISFRAASTAIIVLATSTAVRRSNGFGSPLSVHRSASCLHLSRRKKKLSSYGRGFGKDDVSKSKAIQDLSTILPSDGSGDEILDDDMSSLNEQSRSTFKNTRKRMNNSSGETQRDSSKVSSSLLPPTMKSGSKDQDSNPTDTQANDLSSWEDFFGSMSPGRSGENYREKNDIEKTNSLKNKKKQGNRSRSAHTSNSAGDGVSSSSNIDRKDLLPSIADLFPSNYTGSNLEATRREGSSSNKSENLKDNIFPSSSPTLEGVMPVSDLFYRSVQTVGDGGQNDNDKEGVHSNGRDDEELPFSAEQSNQLSTSQNKIKIRRNQVKSQKFGSSTSTKNNSDLGTTNRKKPRKNKKLQRRGMEMLVGGVPINADPPQRSIELTYDYDKNVDWKDVIATNTRDFGPMYYRPSVGKLLEEEKGLYCEFFVNSTLKWNVCPKDLRDITLNKNEDVLTEEDTLDNIDKNEVDDFQSIEMKGDLSGNSTEKTMKEALRRRMAGSMKEAFRKAANMADDKNKPFSVNANAELSGELVFSIGVSKDDLESSGGSESAKAVLKRVLATGISTSSQCKGFDVKFSKLQLSDLGDGTTSIAAAFVLTIENNTSMSFAEVKKKNNEINSSLAQAMDDGDMQLAMAAAAKREKAWSNDFRNRIVEEFLFDNDDGDEPLDDENPKKEPDLESTIDSLLKDLNYEVQGFKKDRADVPFGMPGSPVYSKDDLFLGGGNDGVFWNYAAENAMGAPYEGKLGLRMVDAVTERAKHRHPRVIAIGDVHGCIDELQDLLRECDYRPGDLVVFLGDLVSKGPDSFAVVQMAREIGAIGVRGNHDFEVVRWHQAIKSGVDPPVVGSEHFHIANCLTKADMKWMYSLPWYISSPDLGALFVHAGFVSGIRLAKQNPRLMMNMRSILPDGTVTSKFFNNWPWARLWDGPQTVLFGHDADRGLQQYEHAIGLDTGCVYGGRLTACILPEKRLVSVNARRQYFKYRRKHYD